MAGTMNRLMKYLPKARCMIKANLLALPLRSKLHCKPIYISPGHNINMQQSVDVIKNCIRGYRIPEPTRQAHLLVNKIRIENGEDKTKQLGLFD
jgi:deoxyribonuclease V